MSSSLRQSMIQDPALLALLRNERFLWNVVLLAREAERKLQEREKCLGAVLEDANLLWDVLHRVMDSDLQECRLVCRHWRDICYELPVKLRVPVNQASLSAVAKFQKATSVVLYRPSLPSPSPEDGAAVLKCLQSMKNVTHLMIDASIDVTDVLLEKSESLSLVKQSSGVRSSDDASVWQLPGKMTNLTSLCFRRRLDQNLRVPLPYASCMKSLELNLSDFGDFMHETPTDSLVRLTRLCLMMQSGQGPVNIAFDEFPLQTHFPSLKALTISCLTWNDLLPAKAQVFSFLNLGVTLESLEFDSVEIHGADVFLGLYKMKRLHTLRMTNVTLGHQTVKFEQLSGLEELQALTLYPIHSSSQENLWEVLDLRDFMRLTKLHIYSRYAADCLPNVPSLKDVYIAFQNGRIIRTHLFSLINLETLYLDTLVSVPYSFLCSLKKLKKLTIRGNGLSEIDLVSSIASLPDLTHLEFSNHSRCSDQYLKILSRNTRLQSLTIRNARGKPMKGSALLGQGKMTHLRYLKLVDVEDEVEMNSLWKGMPCLRKLVIERKKLMKKA